MFVERVRIGVMGLMGVTVLVMPGCIVWDIKDQIALSNENLAGIERHLGSIDQHLEGINANLDSMGGDLDSMDAHLASLQAQLDATNAHLQSLRKTINSIDSTIPFLKLSGDSEDEKEMLGGEQPPSTDSKPTGKEPGHE